MVLSISVQLLNGYIQSQSTHRKKQKLDPPWFRGNHDQKAKKIFETSTNDFVNDHTGVFLSCR